MFYKKVLSTVMALMLLINISPTVSATDSATSGSCGDKVNYSFDSSNGILTISGTGMMDEYTSDTRPWKEYTDSIKSMVIENGVTSIGSGTFYGCNNLEAITFPNSVTSIGVGAFYFCTKLTSITIPGSVTS